MNSRILRAITKANRDLQHSIAFLAVFAIALTGYLLLHASRAATPTAHFEGENAALATGAVVGNDPTASNSQFTQFNSSPVPTPTPPPPAGSCPAFPAFPDANCTGWQHTGVALATQGAITITTNGATYDSIHFTGQVTVRANNVKLSRCWVDQRITIVSGFTGLTITDCEIGNAASPYSGSSIGDGDYACLRCNIHHGEDGLRANQNVTVEDSIIHDLYFHDQTHNDGIQVAGGGNLIFRHNSILNSNNQTAAILLSTNIGSINNVLIENNLLGGGGYTLYCGTSSSGTATNTRVKNNRWSKQFFPKSGSFGPATSCGGVVEWLNNTYEDGQVINP